VIFANIIPNNNNIRIYHNHNGTHRPTQPKEVKNPKEFLNLLKEGKSADKSKKPAKKSTHIAMQLST
jgi:hypothetical protein